MVEWWMIVGAVAAGVLVAYALYEARRPRLTEIDVRDSRIPEALDGLSLLFLTDFHHGPFFSRAWLKAIVERANALSPDAVLLGGDYVQQGRRYIAPCFEELARLSAPLGVFGVLGNHDHWEDADATRRAMARAGITCLDNAAVWLERNGGRLRLGGVGDLWEDQPDLAPTLAGVNGRDFVLLLSHNPDYAEIIPGDHVQLMLSGHTHGGQCSVFGLWAPFIPSKYGQKYRAGVVQAQKTTVLVSRGLGAGTPPVRFAAPPEMILVKLRRPASAVVSLRPVLETISR